MISGRTPPPPQTTKKKKKKKKKRRHLKPLTWILSSCSINPPVRGHVKYCNVIAFPQFEKQAKLVEGVQRRATKITPEINDLGIVDRLGRLNLPCLYYRRNHGVMIEAYRYTHGAYRSKPLHTAPGG